MEDEIQRRLVLINRVDFSLQRKYETKLLSGTTKSLLYKTWVVPRLLYLSKTSILSRSIENARVTFERKILRQMYGSLEEGEVSGEKKLMKSYITCYTT